MPSTYVQLGLRALVGIVATQLLVVFPHAPHVLEVYGSWQMMTVHPRMSSAFSSSRWWKT